MRDLIDRQRAIETICLAICEENKPCDWECTEITILKKLPSAERRGRWIDDELSAKRGWYFANCSECGCQMDVHENRGYYRYCPNCGCAMKG